MSIRRVNCPNCGAAANVPAALTNVKCAECGAVWSMKGNSPATLTAGTKSESSKSAAAKSAEIPTLETETPAISPVALLAGLVGGLMLLMALIGLAVMVLSRQPDPAQVAATEPEQTIKPATPEPYREIRLPEDTRRRIYNDYRQVARTTVEVPLVLPQGTKARASLEDTLQKTFERELMHFAALHDISVDDVKEVIKEGDAKVWDDSPRSNAVRDGKRVYTKEMSEGWQKNPNRK